MEILIPFVCWIQNLKYFLALKVSPFGLKVGQK